MINAEQTICVRIMCKNCNEDFTKDETPIENFRDRILILSNYIRGVVYSNKLKRSDDKTYLYERVHCFNCKNTIGKLIRSSINAKQTMINHIKLKLQNVIM